MTNPNEQYLEKPLPSSPESEKTLLGAILLDNSLFKSVALMLRADDFYSPLHRRVFEAMDSLTRRHQKIDPILIGEELKKKGQLENIGGIATITNLTFGLPHFSNVEIYCEVVKEKSDLRKIIGITRQMLQDALSEETAAKDIARRAASELVLVGSQVEKPIEIKRSAAKVRERLESWINAGEKPIAVPSSIPELNAALRYGGYSPNDLIFCAARPSIGKTALMLDTIAAAAMAGFPSLAFSLEMSDEDLLMRMLPKIAGVRNMDIKPALYRRNEEVRGRIENAIQQVEKLPIKFDRSMVIEDLLAKAEIEIVQNGVKFITLDYLQLMKATKRAKRRDLELEEITQQLKDFAVQFNVPVLALAQLNRSADIDDRRPEMQDIREAGASEQIVDLLIMPYRKESRRKEKGKKAVEDEIEETSPIVEVNLFIAKQRNGGAGFDIRTDFDMDYQRFMSSTLWREDRLNKFSVE